MKVTKLDVGYDYDFNLFGLSSSLKDYRLAWTLNKSLKIELGQVTDHEVITSKSEVVHIPMYLYETEYSVVRVLRNKAVEDGSTLHYIAPELQHFDFFLLADGPIIEENMHFVDQLKAVKGVEYVQAIAIDKMKSKDNFIF